MRNRCCRRVNDSGRAITRVDFTRTVVKASVVVTGFMPVDIAVSAVDTAQVDEHEIFRYRMPAIGASTCEPEKAPLQRLDIEYQEADDDSLAACLAALLDI